MYSLLAQASETLLSRVYCLEDSFMLSKAPIRTRRIVSTSEKRRKTDKVKKRTDGQAMAENQKLNIIWTSIGKLTICRRQVRRQAK